MFRQSSNRLGELKQKIGHGTIAPYEQLRIYTNVYMIAAMTPLFDVLSDASRRHILALLAAEGELCVCELVAALDDIQPKVSRHLAILREAGWVEARREGAWMFYRLATLPAWGEQVIAALLQGGVPPAELAKSRKRLARFAGRPARNAEEPA